jgi:hypothetical protein
MLAASNTGAIILGIVGLLILIGLLYLGFRVVVIAIKLLIRLITWPVRALRGSPPTGAGADYEAMIRQQPKGRPATGSGEPRYWPPPQDWQPTPQPETRVESQIVLPPPSYRVREPEAEPVTPPVAVSEPTLPPPSRWERLMRTPVRTPAWAMLSLAWLGLWSIVSKPFFGAGWVSYAVGLALAVGIGVWAKRNYHGKILWRAPREVLVWQRWGKQDDSLPLPVVVQAAAEAVAATEAPDSETPVAAP